MFDIEMMPRKRTIWQEPIVIFGLWAIPILIGGIYAASAAANFFEKIDVAFSKVPALEKEVKELKAQLAKKELAAAGAEIVPAVVVTEYAESVVPVVASAKRIKAAPTPIPTYRRAQVATQKIVHRPPPVFVDLPKDPEPAPEPEPEQKETIPEGGNFTLLSDTSATVVVNGGKFKLLGDE